MLIDSQLKRIAMILILGTMIISINYYYGIESNKHLNYPSYGAILDYYPVGELVYIQGSVIEMDSSGYTIVDKYHNQPVIINVSGKFPGKLGDHISLLGVLEPSYHVKDVKKSHVMSGDKYYFSLKRSLVAIIFLLIVFVYYWKFDFKAFIFRRR